MDTQARAHTHKNQLGNDKKKQSSQNKSSNNKKHLPIGRSIVHVRYNTAKMYQKET